MQNNQIGFAFSLPPTKAIKFLKSKRIFLENVDDVALLNSARARAVKIANLSSLDMMKDIYQSLETAKAEGVAFSEWKKNLLQHFYKKGWIAGYDKSFLLADPKTGEFFGTPRRLDTIYRVNVQSAYSAQRYQEQMNNAKARPFWQYSAVNDDRTRPSHSAMNGLVYRYDDPFWSVFYPPNGFNCRCSVIALSERDVKRRNLVVESGNGRLVEYTRKINLTATEKTTAFKLSENKFLITDRGFDYNPGRTQYRPNLDNYPENLAYQFTKNEMGGDVFKFDYQQFTNEITPLIPVLSGLKGELKNKALVKARNQLKRDYSFCAGVLSEQTKKQLGIDFGTVILSDDTLIKQLVNRNSQNFTVNDYANIPDILFNPFKIIQHTENTYQVYKLINDKKFLVVIKILRKEKEIFVQSFRLVSEKQWNKALNGG